MLKIILLIPLLAGAQQAIRTYNVNDGLPSSGTTVLYPDKYGYIWIGSRGGLSRFDGREFVKYGMEDGLPSLNCDKVFQDSRDRLWIGNNVTVAQYKNYRFITYPTSDHLTNTGVFSFIENKDSSIWALTTKGIYHFADTIWNKISLVPGYDNVNCRNLVEYQGELYVNYSTSIYCKTRLGNWMLIDSMAGNDNAFNVMSIQAGVLWVSTKSALLKIHNHQLVPFLIRETPVVDYFSYLIDSKNRLWLAGTNLLKYSEPGRWNHFLHTLDQSGFHYFISEDLKQNIWTGTNHGLLRINDISFTILDNIGNKPMNGIYNALVLPDNSLLLSSGIQDGMQLLSKGKFRQIKAPPGPGNINYYRDPADVFCFDRENRLWIFTRFFRFLLFNKGSLVDFSSSLHLKPNEYIYDGTYIKRLNRFLICADSTLLIGNAQGFKPFLPANTGMPIIKPTRVHELKNGLILLYLNNLGVFCIDKANNLHSLVSQTGIDGSNKGAFFSINYFFEGADSTCWIDYPGSGLLQYDFKDNLRPRLINHLTVSDGLQSNHVIGITSDPQQRIWVASSPGLDILQKNDQGKWEIFNYLKSENLTIDQLENEKILSDKNGTIWLTTANKIIRFNSNGITLKKAPPRITIEKVYLDFKETDWSKLSDSLYNYSQLPFNPRLNYRQNSLAIYFNALDISSSNTAYSYKLIPLDTAWSNPSKIKSVSFAQLHPGVYTFMVKANDLSSGWSRPAVFTFTITPPFWEKWWFRLLVFLILFCLVLGFFRSRIAKIRRQSAIENQLKELEMKALKAQMNPHFIYNALNSIQALVATDRKEEGIRYIGSFSKLLRQVLYNSEYAVITLDKELETIGLYIQLEALRLDMELNYKIEVPDHIVTEFEKIPPLILQPFVENALWHGLSRKEGQRSITISLEADNAWLVCKITDNGVGREKAAEWKNNFLDIHPSKGLEITGKRLADFNDDHLHPPFEFQDLYDHEHRPAGTTVIVYIRRKNIKSPLSFPHPSQGFRS